MLGGNSEEIHKGEHAKLHTYRKASFRLCVFSSLNTTNSLSAHKLQDDPSKILAELYYRMYDYVGSQGRRLRCTAVKEK